ncbi:hypothetical protein K431DRAFT_40547 [Polychaeton citri CBS 116435]|uniref:Uncharacterized protein n=1 Tax=Polychaeton citri CBS 116435 TaxID=1314669 RepID=A0A9P4QD91_9PEZI|nr:hypothetical protein K431DRAFT_40547 [Polychaeton citri CBS 116435]
MSAYDYDDEPRRYRTTTTRRRDPDDAGYIREETYIERGTGPGPRNRELVYRGRDESIEDIQRDFPPPRDYGPSVAAGAGYAAGRRGSSRHRRRRDRDYDSDYSGSRSRSPPPPRRERRKSGIQDTLAGLGLGGIAGAVLGNKDKRSGSRGSDRSRRSRRTRRSSSGSSRSRSRGGGGHNTERKWAQAAQAALVAGAIEAFRSRKEPGPWTGDKGKRIATAAIGAGGIDGLLDRNPDTKKKRHLAEAVIGGLAANRIANGPRSKSRGPERDLSPDEYDTASTRRSRSVAASDRGRARGQDRDINGSNGALTRTAGAGAGAGALSRSGDHGDDIKGNGDSESSSTTDLENRRKKMRGKELITAGLATIATIHAAHGVYSSMEAHEKRHKLVAEGEMTPEEARKKQTKAWVQDAAAVGIAALGIKGAFSEWKEMKEQRFVTCSLPLRYQSLQRQLTLRVLGTKCMRSRNARTYVASVSKRRRNRRRASSASAGCRQ